MSRELIYLIAQSLCILVFIAWICILAIKLQYQKYSYYYIIMRYVFYNDSVPANWLWKHKIYLYYTMQIIALFFINTGLIAQIRDESVYDKSWTIFAGYYLLAASVILSLQFFSNRLNEVKKDAKKVF